MINMVGNSNFSKSTGGSSFRSHPRRCERDAPNSNVSPAYAKSIYLFRFIYKTARITFCCFSDTMCTAFLLCSRRININDSNYVLYRRFGRNGRARTAGARRGKGGSGQNVNDFNASNTICKIIKTILYCTREHYEYEITVFRHFFNIETIERVVPVFRLPHLAPPSSHIICTFEVWPFCSRDVSTF